MKKKKKNERQPTICNDFRKKIDKKTLRQENRGTERLIEKERWRERERE